MIEDIKKTLLNKPSLETWNNLLDLINLCELSNRNFDYIYSILESWPSNIRRKISSNWFSKIETERKVLFCNELGEHPPYLKEMENMPYLSNINSINIEEQPDYYDTSYNLDDYPFDDIDYLSIADDFISQENLLSLISSDCIQNGLTELHLRGHIINEKIWDKICSIERIGYLSMFNTVIKKSVKNKVNANSLELHNVENIDLENQINTENLNCIYSNNVDGKNLNNFLNTLKEKRIDLFIQLK